MFVRTHSDGKLKGKKDKRYTVNLEWVGEVKPRYVLRFCDDYVGDFSSVPAATLRAIGHHAEMMGAYVFVNQEGMP